MSGCPERCYYCDYFYSIKTARGDGRESNVWPLGTNTLGREEMSGESTRAMS